MLSDYKTVKEIINDSDEFKKFRTAVEGYEVLAKIPEIFPELNAFLNAKKVEGKTLFIRVNNSVMRSELSLNRNKIIDKINKHFNKKIIENIRFI